MSLCDMCWNYAICSECQEKIGSERKKIVLERKRINELASEIHDELMSPGANYDDLREWADEIIKLTGENKK